MSQDLSHGPDADVIVHRGIVTRGELNVRYCTLQPAPTQWIAVGVVSTGRLLVGEGASEDGAIQSLAERLSLLGAPAWGADSVSGPPVESDTDASDWFG